ncbi:MAG TPA: S8 family serine peptidase [Gemmatimonadales bacterium]|nr:S8 family serine peptidase [Gemmatimonadales bacterium]
MPSPRFTFAALAVALACGPKQPASEPEPTPERPLPKPNIDPGRIPPEKIKVPPSVTRDEPESSDTLRPIAPPVVAQAQGWMSLASTGVDDFLRRHPTYDGRGVLIGILDTGIDPGIPGLERTSTGAPKLLDLRDFSDEGAVPLRRVVAAGDSVEIDGRKLGGFGRVAALNTEGPYYGGTISEIPLGEPPGSDLNGNGVVSDTLSVVVTRATDGWVLLADTDGDGTLTGERPIHDYLVAREIFGWSRRGRPSQINIAANFSSGTGEPRLTLVFDNFGHGSHVAGIAAGHDLYGLPGFSGVAPGAQLLGLKMALGAQGGITTTGSMMRAVDYAIRFAKARRLPLVLNMSFGVGNEIEGQARVDQLLDSVLAVHPDLPFTIAAGNDGPGLSTVGFPGSAGRAIGVGATVPAGFQPAASPSAKREDQLAFFSSRGGELAKPEIVAPGVAYSAVPRWNTGNEIAQGTSMAAPHAAGLVALLLSASMQEKRSVDAKTIKQALMVTARPLPGGSFIDEGTGLPDVEQAYQWLRGDRKVAEIGVRALGRDGVTAAFRDLGPGARASEVQQFELTRPAGAPAATYTLRSDAAWISAPPRVTLSGRRNVAEVRYDFTALKPPGAHVGTVTGWGADSLMGPAFRLVSTVIAPEPVVAGTRDLRSGSRVEPGTALRTFFRADSGRAFQVRVSGGASEKGLAFLHEPDGMPFRDESARPIGGREGAAVYQVDASDVVAGTYEMVALAPPVHGLAAGVRVTHSPLGLRFTRNANDVVATISNLTSSPVETELAILMGGGERVYTIATRGSGVQRIPFVAPAWADNVVIDVLMDRAQWGRFTDFGVTLFDSVGRQIERQPLNYAFGRLQAALPEGHEDMPVELRLFPGFADPAGDEQWTLRASIRLYADSAVALERPRQAPATIAVAPGKNASVVYSLPASPWPLPDGFFPLGVLVAQAAEHTWTREGGLPLPASPATQ